MQVQPLPKNQDNSVDSLVENFAQYFEIIYANTPDLLSAVYKIRYDVFCEELRTEENCPKDVECDQFDPYAHHFLLKHRRSGEFAGTVRFIVPPPNDPSCQLPFEKYCLHAFDPQILDPRKLKHGTYGEVSRLAVPARFRKRVGEAGKPYIIEAVESQHRADEKRLFPYISVGLYLTCAAFFVYQQLEYAFVMVEPRLARSMARIGIRFEQAGNIVEYHGQRAPFYITQPMLKSGLKPEIHNLFQHIKQEVVRQLVPANIEKARFTG